MSAWNTTWYFKRFSTKSVNKHCPERSTQAIYEAWQCMQCWKSACQIKPLCSRTQLIDWYLLPMCQALNQRFAGIQTKTEGHIQTAKWGTEHAKTISGLQFNRQCQILLMLRQCTCREFILHTCTHTNSFPDGPHLIVKVNAIQNNNCNYIIIYDIYYTFIFSII